MMEDLLIVAYCPVTNISCIFMYMY